MTNISEVTAMTPSAASRQLDAAASNLRAARAQGAGAADPAGEAAKQFEAVFLTQLVDTMFSGLKTDGYFGGGHAEKMWRGFLVEHIAEAFAERGGVGIADSIKAQIIQMSERTP